MDWVEDGKRGISFLKMEGAGNDYIYVDCFEQTVGNPQAFARRVSQRHFGVGSDGVIFIKPSVRGDCFMDMYNADGSRGKMCGNGLRCVAWYIHKKLGMARRTIRVETLSGLHECVVETAAGRKAWVRAEMGRAQLLENKNFPLWETAQRLPVGLHIVGTQLVDVGNLHCVLFLEWPGHGSDTAEQIMSSLDIKAAGAFLENYTGFDGSVNVEFCMKDVSPNRFFGGKMCGSAWRVRVWERGSAETLSCGSGACAVFAAAGAYDSPCCIFMNGGRLCVEQSKQGKLLLSGETAVVFEGCIFG